MSTAKRYRRRVGSFTAIQYDGFNYSLVYEFMGIKELPEPFHTFDHGMLTFRPDVPIPVVTSTEKTMAKTNDYIKKDYTGELSVWNPIEFGLRHVEVP
jgi:hypothetical protein